jgi:hypothetical protein
MKIAMLAVLICLVACSAESEATQMDACKRMCAPQNVASFKPPSWSMSSVECLCFLGDAGR